MQKNNYRLLLMLLLTPCFTFQLEAQEAEQREMILSISYHLPFDKIPFIKVSAKEKIDRKFLPLKDIDANVYMGEESEAGLLGKIKTNEKGEGNIYFPAAFKSRWDSLELFTFIVVTEANKIFESTTSEIEIVKARLEIDTLSDEESKNISVNVTELKNGEWVPARETELRIVVKRLLGNLPIGEEETYTTNEEGSVEAEFIRDSLPGDDKGFLTLVARTDESELYGNIAIEMKVPWGVPAKVDNTFFDQRTLWSTRDRTPYWLIFLAYTIIIGVWVTLIYLFFQLYKVKKLNAAEH